MTYPVANGQPGIASIPSPSNRTEIPMIGEIGRTRGLAIVPRLELSADSGYRFTGSWKVVHAESGMPILAVLGMGLGHARDGLDLLDELDVDWTQPFRVIRATYRSSSETVLAFNDRAMAAVQESRPLLTSPSWRPLDNRWFVYNPGIDEFVADLLDSYEAAEGQRRYFEIHGITSGPSEIGQRQDRQWALQCASPRCRVDLEGDERPPFTHTDPSVVTDLALDEEWRRIDEQHWLCSECSSLFTGARF